MPEVNKLECIRAGNEGVFVDLHVVPGSKKESFDYDSFSKRLKVKISSQAIDGKANRQVIDIFSGFFGNCEIVSGSKSRKKTILICGLDKESVLTALCGRLKL